MAKFAAADRFAARSPRAYGLAVTVLGVLVFVPDALVLKLIGADMLTVAVYRGLMAAAALLIGFALLAPGGLPTRDKLFSRIALTVAALEGTGMVLFCAAIGATSAANALLILATAPFIAALLSWALLGERIAPQTGVAIAVSFTGVVIIASGGIGGGAFWGDLLALGNAVAMAGFYVALRAGRDMPMIPAIGIGYIFGSGLAALFATFEPLDAQQFGWLALNGLVILPGAIALLTVGPRYLPAAEVSMLTMLEIVLAPVLVWAVLGENPGARTLLGGGVILIALFAHALWRLRAAPGGAKPAPVSPPS